MHSFNMRSKTGGQPAWYTDGIHILVQCTCVAAIKRLQCLNSAQPMYRPNIAIYTVIHRADAFFVGDGRRDRYSVFLIAVIDTYLRRGVVRRGVIYRRMSRVVYYMRMSDQQHSQSY